MSPLTTASAKPRAKDRNLLLRILGNPLGAFSLLILGIYVAWAIAPAAFAGYDPDRADFTAMTQGPSLGHLLGTDDIGRDIFSRVVWASRYSLLPAATSVVVAVLLGVSIGVLAGYFGKGWDLVGNWTSNFLMTLPIMVVLVSAAAIIGSSTYAIMAVFGVMLMPAFYRLCFVVVRGVRDELYVDAARIAGLSDLRIMVRHIIPVVRAPIIIQAGFLSAIAITIQSGLQFLGVGDSSLPSWGTMLTVAYQQIQVRPADMIVPVAALSLIMLALIFLSNVLRDELEGSARGRGTPEEQVQPAETNNAPIMHGDESSAREVVLAVESLAIAYKLPNGGMTTVVHDATLTVARGEVVGLVGESGSGKTQTALAVMGLLAEGGEIRTGSITFAGQELSGLSFAEYSQIRGSGIAYIPQEPMSGLDPSFTIGSQLSEPMRSRLGLSKRAAKARALELLAQVGLPDPKKTYNSYPHEVSGGQAQRVLIAGALSLKPDVIIADEPTTALDVTVQAEILDILRTLQQDSGVAILLVTHNFGVVADLCDRVVIMQRGRIVETGSSAAIFSAAKHPYTRELLGAILDESMPARAQYRDPLSGADDAPPLAVFSNVEVTYHGKRLGSHGFKALRGVSLDIRPGETVGLVGESGSGKTTLGRALLGLAPVTGGSIEFAGQDLTRASRATRHEIARSLQVVFQDPYRSLNPALSIGQILAEPLTAQGVDEASANARVRELLDAVALPGDAAERRPREFSGGQRQRIAIARALALDPKLIVCDEPVSALDLSTSARVLDLLLEIQERTGVAYLFISHDLAVVRHVSHRVAVMHHGEIVEWGHGDQVTGRPQHPYTQRLMMAAPVADPSRQAARRAARLELARS